jgi:chloramphenicol O-acetyltransferase
MAMEPKFGVQYTPYKSLNCGWRYLRKARQPHQVSRPNCRKLSTLFIPICPALEVLSFIVTNKFKTNERDIAPQCIFKLRKTANGEWEERGFGVKMPEGARGFPIIEYKS